jgi:hypothetical protein
MLAIKNVPIVIEPGLEVIEVELSINDLADPRQKTRHRLPTHLYRVPLDEKVMQELPLVPTTKTPNIFSATTNLKKSPALVVYDALGRIHTIYTRNADRKYWERFDVAEEHSGKAITQFSVRFVFNTVKDRGRFLQLMDKLVESASREAAPQMDDVMAALRILARSRVAPVVLPVASEKCTMSKIKL